MSNESKIKQMEERIQDLEMFCTILTEQCHMAFESKQEIISAIERLGLVKEIRAELNSMKASE